MVVHKKVQSKNITSTNMACWETLYIFVYCFVLFFWFLKEGDGYYGMTTEIPSICWISWGNIINVMALFFIFIMAM